MRYQILLTPDKAIISLVGAMPLHPAKAVANEILTRLGRSGMPGQMWLQKMVYIAHGWNLAVNGEPLVSESPEAWDGGPVYREIWDHLRDYGVDPKTRLLADPVTKDSYHTDLSRQEQAVIDHVWEKYRRYSGRDLSRLTHMPGTPWTEIYLSEGRDSAIPNKLIKKHYTDLALAGRAPKQ